MKTSATFLITATTVLVSLAFGLPATAQAGCKHSADPIRSISKKNARSAIGCLFNDRRSSANVKRRGDIEKAAQNHSATMARQWCLSHQCPGEANLKVRVERTGYLRGASGYELGEVVLSGPAKSSARDVVSRWMNSSGHRAVIMKSSYDHAGVGLSIRSGVVFATGDFGHR